MTQDKIKAACLEARVFQLGREYLEREEFVELFPPRVVRASGACENVDTLFKVMGNDDPLWFKDKEGQGVRSYLAQTGQLYLEALVPYLGKVYCVGPSFRAEAGDDNRHLTEFTMVEIEFAGDFDQLLAHIEGFVYAIARGLASLTGPERRQVSLTDEDIKRLGGIQPTFPKITYDQAVEKLGLAWGDDINSVDEQKLVVMHDDQPLLITRYPDPLWDHGREIEVEKFFNMIPDPERPGRVLSADLIVPIAGEAVGAAARIHDSQTLEKRLLSSRMFRRLEKLGGDVRDFGWYIEQVKEKTVPHSGCGFGMSRLLRWIQGTDDIKKAVTFPSNQRHLI